MSTSTSSKATIALSSAADGAYLKKRALPVAPDGQYDYQVNGNSNSREAHSSLTNLISDVELLKNMSGMFDSKLAEAAVDALLHPALDDRKGVVSYGLRALADLPDHLPAKKKMADAGITALYETIPHPAASYLGSEYRFRKADGAGNNLQNPTVGQAGTPYARSVQRKRCVDNSALPSPDLIFETLLKARQHKVHPGGNSSFQFAYAGLVTHSLFFSSYTDPNINNTSSYLDLSPLYGTNQASQDRVRDKATGRGLMYPDTFSEERLMFLPPATSVLLVLFCRNHNFICDKLLKINERRKWSDPPPTNDAARAKQDEEIFQTAKLINCGHFMKAIFKDYVAGFLGRPDGPVWDMNPFEPIKTKAGVVVTRGQGNHCSIEFSLLYRWHATTSAPDIKWTENQFKKVFKKPHTEVTFQDFLKGGLQSILDVAATAPKDRTFDGLKRGHDGKFSDEDLAHCLYAATESPAGSFGARNVPEVMRVVENLGIYQAREWGACTMNEFRRFLGLKEFESFEEWNPDPEIASAARRLYNHIDNLELYVGIQCEETMPLTPGSAFGCGYTMTTAILGDAFALVRGDRFYTSDFTPANLTTWGFQDCQSDPNNGGYGAEMTKLLTRHLPRYYPATSVYSCFPFFTPQKMKASLTRQGLDKLYTFTRPEPEVIPKILNDLDAIKYVCNDPKRFNTAYQLQALGNGYGFFLMFDDDARHSKDKALAMHALFPNAQALDEYRKYYREQVGKYIKERSWKYDGMKGTYFNVVDAINTANVHWVADKMVGLSLKTKENPRGMFTEQEVYAMCTVLHSAGLIGYGDNEHQASLAAAALPAGAIFTATAAKSILEVAPQSASSWLVRLFGRVLHAVRPVAEQPYHPFLRRLSDTGRPLNEILAFVLGLSVGSSADYAQQAVQVVNFYIDDSRAAERKHIIELSNRNDDESFRLLVSYVKEAMRLDPQGPGLWRVAATDAIIPASPGHSEVHVRKGDRIWCSIKNGHRDPRHFPDPLKVKLDRPKDSYCLNGTGYHVCLGVTYAEVTIAEILKLVFKLKNIRRAHGDAGRLVQYTEVVDGTEKPMYIQANGVPSIWPGPMFLVHDE